jgi:hypothetical protein
MKKVTGIEAVEVSLEKAVTDIRLAAGNTVTLAQIRDIIRSNGFNAREATVTASGRMRLEKDQLLVDLAPARVVLTIEPAAAGAAMIDARKIAASGAQEVEISGVIPKGDSISLAKITRR